MTNEVQNIIDFLDLTPHPEGGYFKEIYRNTGVIPNQYLGTNFEGNRNIATGIYFYYLQIHFRLFIEFNKMKLGIFTKGVL